MSKAAKKLMYDEDDYQYGVIGADTCMGDHKVISSNYVDRTSALNNLNFFTARFFEVPNQNKSRYSQ